MKIFYVILIILGILVAIPLVIALFVKKEYSVEREIVIDTPKQDVFNYVKYLKNQDNYNKWVMLDPTMKKEFKGIDGTEGFVYAWDSKNKNAGEGAQEIKKLIDGERVDIEINFIRPFKGVAHVHMVTEAVSENQTRVKWGMKGQSKYPMNFMNLIIDGMLGPDLETSLTTLKNILEKQ